MSEDASATKAIQTILDHDKEKRLQEEADILEKAHALTNGSAGDSKIIGEVMHWQVTETIAQGKLLRVIVDTHSKFQLKSDCAAILQPKTWVVKMFGTSYQVPTTTFIIVVGFLVYSWARANGYL